MAEATELQRLGPRRMKSPGPKRDAGIRTRIGARGSEKFEHDRWNRKKRRWFLPWAAGKFWVRIDGCPRILNFWVHEEVVEEERRLLALVDDGRKSKMLASAGERDVKQAALFLNVKIAGGLFLLHQVGEEIQRWGVARRKGSHVCERRRMKTCGNSRPLAEWTVINCTASSASSSSRMISPPASSEIVEIFEEVAELACPRFSSATRARIRRGDRDSGDPASEDERSESQARDKLIEKIGGGAAAGALAQACEELRRVRQDARRDGSKGVSLLRGF